MHMRLGPVLLATAMAAGAWLGTACEQAPPADPVATYRAFYAAVAHKQPDRWVALLTPEARQAFVRVGRRLAAAAEHEGDPLDFFMQHASQAVVVQPLRQVEVVERSGDRARLRVVAGECAGEQPVDGGGCSVSEVRLLRIDGAWLIAVELPAGLADPDAQQPPQPAEAEQPEEPAAAAERDQQQSEAVEE
jgi:hypothetical protein